MRLGKEFYREMRKNNLKKGYEDFSDFSVEEYKGYEFQTWTNVKNKPVLRIYKGKSGKPVSYYYYMSEKFRQVAIDRYKQSADSAEVRKLEKKKAQKNLTNPYKVGEIVYDSWGYEQTNIDFYQITKVLPKSVKIRPIAQELVEATGMDQGNVLPIKDKFTGDEVTKRVLPYNNKGEVYIKSRHGWISKFTGEPVWSSWYY